MITHSENSTTITTCTPCQQHAMANMSLAQKLLFMKHAGLTKELKALEASLANKDYNLPAPKEL